MQDTKKIKVSMWPDLLPYIDAAAKRLGMRRSAFLRYSALQIINRDFPDLVPMPKKFTVAGADAENTLDKPAPPLSQRL